MAIADENDLLVAVANGLEHWSHVELRMSQLFQFTSGMEREKAVALFDCIVSFDVRLEILDRMISFAGFDEIEMSMWDALSSRMSKQYKRRHELAHFITGADPKGRPVLFPFMTFEKMRSGEAKSLSIGDIEGRIERFDDIRIALDWFLLKYWEKEGVTAPRPAKIEPEFVARLRESAVLTLEARQRPQPRPRETDGDG